MRTVFEHFISCRIEHRTNQRDTFTQTSLLKDATQPSRRRATNQPQENRFHLIIASVRSGDDVTTVRLSNSGKKRISHFAGDGLDVSPGLSSSLSDGGSLTFK